MLYHLAFESTNKRLKVTDPRTAFVYHLERFAVDRFKLLREIRRVIRNGRKRAA